MEETNGKKTSQAISPKQWIKAVNNLAITIANIVAVIRLCSKSSSGMSAVGYGLIGGIVAYLSIVCGAFLTFIIIQFLKVLLRFPKIITPLITGTIFIPLIFVAWRYGAPFIIGVVVGVYENPLFIFGEPLDVVRKGVEFAINPEYQMYGTIGGTIVGILFMTEMISEILTILHEENRFG